MGILQAAILTGLPFPSPGALPDPGIELTSLKSPALAGGFLITSATWEAQWIWCLKNGKMKPACEIPLYSAITHHLVPSNSKFKPFSFRYPKISDHDFPHTHSLSSSDPYATSVGGQCVNDISNWVLKDIMFFLIELEGMEVTRQEKNSSWQMGAQPFL